MGARRMRARKQQRRHDARRRSHRWRARGAALIVSLSYPRERDGVALLLPGNVTFGSIKVAHRGRGLALAHRPADRSPAGPVNHAVISC